MSEKAKIKKRAVAIGIVGLVSFMGVATTGLVIAIGAKAPKADSVSVEIDWAALANAKLLQTRHDFAIASFNSGMIKLSGNAPDAQTRTRAFEIARRAIIAAMSVDKSDQKRAIKAFENNITINGEKMDDVRDALTTLPTSPQANDCQTAYDILLAGHVVNFSSGSAIIANDSKPLLSALSAIAVRCVNYRVEVGGHTDSQGDTFANQQLSERRAQAVADFLVGNGVRATQLTVLGYGESKPIDASATAAADAKNRRIEFKISETGIR
ncbi:MAG: OmpA/MotB domain-containing protein [Hyphomonadaceae bacterium]|nr:MAG: OmpA/MotB domain-containing protein [Hyphomonadaceae bacterium]